MSNGGAIPLAYERETSQEIGQSTEIQPLTVEQALSLLEQEHGVSDLFYPGECDKNVGNTHFYGFIAEGLEMPYVAINARTGVVEFSYELENYSGEEKSRNTEQMSEDELITHFLAATDINLDSMGDVKGVVLTAHVSEGMTMLSNGVCRTVWISSRNSNGAFAPESIYAVTPFGSVYQYVSDLECWVLRATAYYESNKVLDAYRSVLHQIYYDNLLPNGSVAVADFELVDSQDNLFALKDINGDGTKELIVLLLRAPVAGQIGMIVEYVEQSGVLEQIYLGTTALVFYENGMLKELWSHNQGYSGEAFWPYSLYQYNRYAGEYVFVGAVDSWDKNVMSAGFPQEIDTSKTGVIYYIGEEENSLYDNPVDASEYLEWIQSHIGNASEIAVEYWPLIPENIDLEEVVGRK